MHIFIDFEASSLARLSYPIEVGWVWEDGRHEGHLICPAPGWTDWDVDAERIHGIPRERLMDEGEPHDLVARRMIEALSGHDLLASAPSWDGKWLSALLRAAGLPRHALRLRDTEAAWQEAAGDALRGAVPDDALAGEASAVIAAVARAVADQPVAHRATDDAERERQRWLAVCGAANARRDALRPARA